MLFLRGKVQKEYESHRPGYNVGWHCLRFDCDCSELVRIHEVDANPKTPKINERGVAIRHTPQRKPLAQGYHPLAMPFAFAK